MEKTSSTVMKKEKDIGDYTIGKTIGEGTFGKVKLGFHNMTGEKVAIKILEKKRIIDVADIERVSREIHILKLIRHPNIVQLYEVLAMQIIETPAKLYLIMEYAPSGELFDYIVAQTRIKEKEACKFFQQIVAGIEYIHKLGVVHRDLKPENLLLDHNHQIKIVDFGLSNTYRDPELLKTACGSPCYAAPEMIAGKEYVGLKVDVWSAGIILFAMVCGYLPFEDPNTRKLYKKILKGVYQAPKYVSDSVKDLIEKILKTNPDERITIEQIRAHQWFNQVQQDISPGILVGYQNIQVDSQVLSMLSSLKVDADYARKLIEANKHNHISTGYYLLLKKHLRNGGTLTIDKPKSKQVQQFRGFSLNLSQEAIPLYRLSHEHLVTPGPRRLFELSRSPKNSTSPKAPNRHVRVVSQIVERNPSPRRLLLDGRLFRSSINAGRPPSREVQKLPRDRKAAPEGKEKHKDTFLRGRVNVKPRAMRLGEEKAALKPVRARPELLI
jgi:serine/threonine protein kinase